MKVLHIKGDCIFEKDFRDQADSGKFIPENAESSKKHPRRQLRSLFQFGTIQEPTLVVYEAEKSNSPMLDGGYYDAAESTVKSIFNGTDNSPIKSKVGLLVITDPDQTWKKASKGKTSKLRRIKSLEPKNRNGLIVRSAIADILAIAREQKKPIDEQIAEVLEHFAAVIAKDGSLVSAT